MYVKIWQKQIKGFTDVFTASLYYAVNTRIIDNDIPYRIISSDEICAIINGFKKNDSHMVNKISKSIREMIAANIICGKETSNGVFKISNSSFEIPEGEFFVAINTKHIYNILTSSRKNKYFLLHFFVRLMCTRDSRVLVPNGAGCKEYPGLVGYMPGVFLAKMMNVSTETIYNSIDTLEKMRVIYVKRDKNCMDPSQKMASIYGAYENAYAVSAYARRAGVGAGLTTEKRSTANESRRMKQRYNALLKGKTYSEPELLELYAYFNDCGNQERADLIYNNFIDVGEPKTDG